ncbi:MAG: SDR family NAD(P)-dependent oxidoreductase [Phycisphaera sp.]|nr:SDR family NAD(P)-dependent oxidoreductase [Phycisphaera sp.]
MSSRLSAIVTGAGSGIGRAVALRLARAGWSVALAGRTDATLRETAEAIREATGNGVDTLIQPTDVADATQCEAMIATVEARYGRIDAVVHSAGFVAMASLAATDASTWRQSIDVNLSAAMYLTHHAWRLFRKQRSGVVVNVSSMASVDPFPGLGAYATAKAGLNMLTRVTATEGAEIGVRAVAVAPGAVETPMLRGLFDEAAIPRSATLAPDDVAELIVGCVTGERDFVSGQTITIVRGDDGTVQTSPVGA